MVLGSCKEPEVILCIRVAVRRVRPVYSLICQSAPQVKSVLVDKIEQGWNMEMDLWGIVKSSGDVYLVICQSVAFQIASVQPNSGEKAQPKS